MKKDLRVAVIQARVPKSASEGEVQINRLVTEACSQQVDMVGLPEDCVCPYDDLRKGYKPFNFLPKVAQQNRVYLFGASTVLDNDWLHNRGFLFNPRGELIGQHDKVVLIPNEVNDGVVAGKSLEIIETEFGKMAILVCKDSFHRYAAWFFDKLRRAGVDVVLVPSYSVNVSQRSIELWTDSLKALAKWFDVYIAAPGTIGKNATEFPSFGHAMLICPKRVVLAEGSFDKEEILRTTFDVKSLEEIRNTYGSKWQPSEVPEVEILT